MLKILYRDEYFVAIDKPAGLLVHRTHLAYHAKEFAMQKLRDQLGQHVFTVHRLDRPTSGVLLFALKSEAASAMSKLFAERRVQKKYLAIVRGFVDAEGKIDHPIKKQQGNGEIILQEAVTFYKKTQEIELPIPVGPYQNSRYSLVEASPKTGRKHQIRLHFSHLRHPIIGDVKHGDLHHNRMFRENLKIPGLMLSAVELTFKHPISGLNIAIQSEASENFGKFRELIQSKAK